MNSFNKISEHDWKILRKLTEELIDDFCGDTLVYVHKIISEESTEDNLKRYQNVFRYIEARENILVRNLNDFRRSNAIRKILELYHIGLLNETHLSMFSDHLISVVKHLESLR